MAKRRSNPSASGIGVMIVAVALSYLGWCTVNYYQTNAWSWKPWEQFLGMITQIGQGEGQ